MAEVKIEEEIKKWLPVIILLGLGYLIYKWIIAPPPPKEVPGAEVKIEIVPVGGSPRRYGSPVELAAGMEYDIYVSVTNTSYRREWKVEEERWVETPISMTYNVQYDVSLDFPGYILDHSLPTFPYTDPTAYTLGPGETTPTPHSLTFRMPEIVPVPNPLPPPEEVPLETFGRSGRVVVRILVAGRGVGMDEEPITVAIPAPEVIYAAAVAVEVR